MQVSAKKLIAINFTILLIVSIGMYAYAQTPTSTVWLSGGVYPGAPSYTVWREGSNYFAKDAFGQIDFSGTNGTEVINNALSGGDVWVYLVPDTTFIIDTWILIDSNTILSGGGWSTIIQIGSGVNKGAIRTENWLVQPDQYNIVIRDLQIDGNQANNPSVANDGAISLRGVYNVLIENVYVKDFRGFAGIYVTGVVTTQPSVKTRIINNFVEGSNGTGSYGCGMFLTGLYYDSLVSGNVLHDNRYGLQIEDNARRLVISGNTITNSSVEGISISNARFLILQSNFVLYTLGYRGIILASGSINNVISGNYVDHSEYAGILVQSGCDNNTITSNIVKNAGITEIPSSGIGIDSDGNIIANNWITEDTALYMDYGIGVSGDNNLIIGNHAEGANIGIYDVGSNTVEHNYNITINW